MTFLHAGLAAAGLACVAIPIIIHLLMRRRRKPIMWGAMRFLLEAYQKHRRRLLLEKWLLLLSRCALVALVGMAIGRPLIGALGGAGAGGRTVYILLDNGIASGASGADGRTALDRAKDRAKAILGTLTSDGDRAALICLGGPAELLVVPPSSDIRAVTSLIEGVAPTDSRTDLAGGFSAVAPAIQAEKSGGTDHRGNRTFVAVLSDYLDGSADLAGVLPRLPEGVRLLTSGPGEGASNVSIVGLEPLRSVVVTGRASDKPGVGPDSVSAVGDQARILLRRTGPSVARAANTTIDVAILRPGAEGPQAPTPRAGTASVVTVHWSPGEETAAASVQVSAPTVPDSRAGPEETNIIEAVIRAAGPDEDALPADNTWRRPIEVREALRVGVVAPRRFGARERVDRLDASEWMRLALRPGESAGVDVVEIEPVSLDSARLAGLDALALPRPDLVPEAAWAKVRLFLDGGGLVLVTPPAGVSVHIWPDAMTKALGLPWRLAREATTFGASGSPAQTVLPGPKVAPAGGDSETSLSRGVLALIEGELADLTRPISVWRTLPMQGEEDSGSRLLTLANGATFVWSGSPAPAAARATPTRGGAAPGEPGSAPASRPAQSGETEKGLVVYLASALDLDWTDLPAKPLMVPLVQEIIKQGIGRARGSFSAIAGAKVAAPARTVELRSQPTLAPRAAAPKDDAAAPQIIPVDETGTGAAPIRRAGLWKAVDERGASRGIIAVNADALGSRTQAQDRSQVEKWLAAATPDGQIVRLDEQGATTDAEGAGSKGLGASAASALSRQAEKSPISFPLLIAAGVLALIELWLARRASHAESGGATVRGVPAMNSRTRTGAA